MMNVHYTHYTIAMQDYNDCPKPRKRATISLGNKITKTSGKSASLTMERIYSALWYRRRNVIDTSKGDDRRKDDHTRRSSMGSPPSVYSNNQNQKRKNGGATMYTPPQPLIERRKGIYLPSADKDCTSDTSSSSDNIDIRPQEPITIKTKRSLDANSSLDPATSECINFDMQQDITVDSTMFVQRKTPIRDITLKSALLCRLPGTKQKLIMMSPPVTLSLGGKDRLFCREEHLRTTSNGCSNGKDTNEDSDEEEIDIRSDENVVPFPQDESTTILEREEVWASKPFTFRRRSVPETAENFLSLSERSVVLSKSSSSRSVQRRVEYDIKEETKRILIRSSDKSQTPSNSEPTIQESQAPRNENSKEMATILQTDMIGYIPQDRLRLSFSAHAEIPEGMHKQSEDSVDDGTMTEAKSDENVKSSDSETSRDTDDPVVHSYQTISTAAEPWQLGACYRFESVSAQFNALSAAKNQAKLLPRWDNIEKKSRPPQYLDNTHHNSKHLLGIDVKRIVPIHHPQTSEKACSKMPLYDIFPKVAHAERSIRAITVVPFSREANEESVHQQLLLRQRLGTKPIPEYLNSLQDSIPSNVVAAARMIDRASDDEYIISRKSWSKMNKMKRDKKSRPKLSQKFVVGVRFGPQGNHQQEFLCRDGSRSIFPINHDHQLDPDEPVLLCLDPACLLQRILYCIPEESVVVALLDDSALLREGGIIEQVLEVIGPIIDLLQRRRRKRQKTRLQISYSYASSVYHGKRDLGGKYSTISMQTASSFVRVALLHKQNRRYHDAFIQFVDALQYCMKEGIPKSNSTLVDIINELKDIREQFILPSSVLCESVLRTLDSRAEREIRKETTIDQAITTLKIALEFRKAMLENILVSMGGDSRYRKSNLLQHVPENVISATARSLLMLSRCFLHKKKVKCAQRSLRDAESLFQSKRVSL